MSGIEKDIKDRLGEHKGSEGIDSQALWDSVASELDATSGTGAFQMSRWLIGVLLLLSVGTLGYFAFGDESNITQEGSSMERVEVDEMGVMSDLDANREDETLSAQDVQIESTLIGRPDQQRDQDDSERSTEGKSQGTRQTKADASKNAQSSLAEGKTIAEIHSANESESIQMRGSTDSPEVSVNMKKENPSEAPAKFSENESLVYETNANASPFQQSQTKEISPTEGKGLFEPSEEKASELRRMSSLNSLLLLNPEKQLRFTLIDIPKLQYRGAPKKGWPSEISLWVGTNVIEEQFGPGSDSNTIGAELQKTTKKDVGTSYAIEINWTSIRGLRLTTGIMVDQFRTRFDRVTERNTSVQLEDQLIGFFPSPTSTPTPIYGTIEQEAIETRTLLNYNDYTFISVPISLGFEKVFKRSKVGIDIGAAWTKSLNQQGRSLNGDGTVASFVDGMAPFATDQITYQVSPFFGKMVDDSFELRLRPTFRSIPRQQSDFYQVDHSAMVYGVQLGLVYHLD